MKTETVVITTVINGRTRFVNIIGRRPDGKHIIECVYSAHDATEFDNEHEARATIRLIHNPFDREFNSETIVVDRKPIFK